MTSTDEVHLAVPAKPEFLRLTRVTAAGLASRLGFSFDEVEDLRLAIDELCYGLTGADGREGTVAVRYELGEDRLVIEGEGHFTPPDSEALLSELSRVILTALVDEHELVATAHGPRFRLVKRRHGPGPGSPDPSSTAR
ncbi:MAG: ATP-binding protein [Acidimicrobiales bacterium]